MTEKKFIYYIFIATLAIVSLVAYFVSTPLIKKIDNMKKDLLGKQTELRQLQKKGDNLKDLELGYKNYQEKIDLLSKMFPKLKEVSDYIVQLENAGLMNGVAFKSMKITGQPQITNQTKEVTDPNLTQLAKTGDFYELPIDITVTSNNYENIVNFVKTTEKLSRFTSIKKTSVKSNETEGNLESTISLTVYVMP